MGSSDRDPRRSGRLATVLATLLGNLYLVFGSVFCGTMSILTAWVPPRLRVFSLWTRWWSQGLLAVSGLRPEVRFTAPLDPHGSYVFMVNHQSLFDIPVMLATLPTPTRFMAKRELFRIPIFGWALAAGGFIPVERGARAAARESFQVAVERLRQGGSILVFPEETRSRDGRLLPFKRGGFLLALKAGVPVVPVGIRGTLAARSRASFVIRPGRVEVAYGEPMAVAELQTGDRAAVMARVRERIAALAGVEASFGDSGEARGAGP